MRDYGKVHASFWSSESTRELSDDAKFLALYLLTCPHAHLSGVFRLPLAYAVEDTGWTAERLRNGFQTLSDASWLCRDERTGWTWIRKWLKWNPPDNPNQWRAVGKQIEAVAEGVPFKASLLSLLPESPQSETVPERLPNLPSPSPSPSLSPSLVGAGEVAIPLVDGTDFLPPVDLLASMHSAYPGVNIPAELAKARAWCVANPAKRKTRRGAGTFLNSWMANAAKDLPKQATPALPGGGRKKLA